MKNVTAAPPPLPKTFWQYLCSLGPGIVMVLALIMRFLFVSLIAKYQLCNERGEGVLDQKGWRGPRYRRVQMYDLLLAIIVFIIFTLAIWTLGAELVFARGTQIKNLDDLTDLLGIALGGGGKLLFYLSVFGVLYTSVVGCALGLGCMASHGYLRWRKGGPGDLPDYSTHSVYKLAVLWIVLSPLVWSLPGMPDFVTLTLVANSLQVVLIPVLVGGVWWITADARYIGTRYRNRWWENAVMAALFALALWAAWGSVESTTRAIRELV